MLLGAVWPVIDRLPTAPSKQLIDKKFEHLYIIYILINVSIRNTRIG